MSDATERIDAIQAQLDAATPGPWQWSPEEDVWGDCGPNLETVKRGPVYSDGSQGADEEIIGSWGHDANGISVDPADAEFIAASPENTRFLLDLARKQQAALESVRKLHAPDDEGDCTHCGDFFCDTRKAEYPCPTIRALDGDDA